MGAYVKFKLGITHFAHIWMENFTCNLETKAFTILARSGFWTHDQQVTCLPLSYLSYPGILISYVQLLFEPLSVCLTSLHFPRVDAIPESMPIYFTRLDAIQASTY